jgi:hypothetical protein
LVSDIPAGGENVDYLFSSEPRLSGNLPFNFEKLQTVSSLTKNVLLNIVDTATSGSGKPWTNDSPNVRFLIINSTENKFYLTTYKYEHFILKVPIQFK